MTIRRISVAAVMTVAVAAYACARPGSTGPAENAAHFLAEVNDSLKRLEIEANQTGWVQQNFITVDTDAIQARANQRVTDAVAKYAKDAVRYDNVAVQPAERRQLDLLKHALVMATPADPKKGEELTTIVARLKSTYGRGRWCQDPAKPDACMNIDGITKVMAESRDEKTLRRAWEGWHTVAPPMRKDYARFVELSNEGAKELGFADTGAMWRAKYDMPPDQFTAEVDRLWNQVRPLYLKLHAYVRMRLHEKYGDVVPASGPIPAHLLGNIWAQEWANIYPLAAPKNADPGYSLTGILERKKMTPLDMVRTGERFYSSLGFAPLPATFWERSLFVRPHDRDVVCHASAWNVDAESDIRIKMCIERTAEDFTTIHHELGHNYYQRAYKDLPALFRDSANDGFHEAVGDTIALSVTPDYLVKIGLLDRAPDASRDIGLLMGRALEKVAFLPFGLLIDQWRWKVFSGEVTPADYNKAWWALRLQYQGIAPPATRGEDMFDPGAKYHVPSNTPYTRYFLADILQFQFHRELARVAGCATALHRCSIYESQAAGAKLNAMLSMGTSKPWQDALAAMTGSRQMDATAILEYFAPLDAWLDRELHGAKVGW